MIDINVLKLSIKLSVAFSKESNYLHIVVVDYLLFISVKSNFFKELLPLN